jgi:hypothetical protein
MGDSSEEGTEDMTGKVMGILVGHSPNCLRS